VAGIEGGQNYANYRLDQASRNWQEPSSNFFFIENKDAFGMQVRVQALNLNDSTRTTSSVRSTSQLAPVSRACALTRSISSKSATAPSVRSFA